MAFKIAQRGMFKFCPFINFTTFSGLYISYIFLYKTRVAKAPGKVKYLRTLGSCAMNHIKNRCYPRVLSTMNCSPKKDWPTMVFVWPRPRFQ